MNEYLKNRFGVIYNNFKASCICRAPGRVNLIGEHTDYNEGYVLPTPINRYVWIAARPRTDKTLRLYADDLNEKTQNSLNQIKYDKKHNWANYVLGVTKVLSKKGYNLTGADLLIKGDIPIAVGLSSSAAIEIAAVRVFEAMNDLNLDPVEAAIIGKKAENDFVGVQCGIMDQYVSSIGEYGEALFIDCRTNEFKKIPLDSQTKIVIVNTMKKRMLADSSYNVRRSECMEGVKILHKRIPEIKALRDVTEDNLNEYWNDLPPTIRKRCRHVVTENQRVLEGIQLIQKGDVEGFGGLMYDSHESLKYDYEVTSDELDFLVDSTMSLDYVLGARMTGAGFGGCTVNLVRKNYVNEFNSRIKQLYFNETGINPEVYSI